MILMESVSFWQFDQYDICGDLYFFSITLCRFLTFINYDTNDSWYNNSDFWGQGESIWNIKYEKKDRKLKKYTIQIKYKNIKIYG